MWVFVEIDCVVMGLHQSNYRMRVIKPKRVFPIIQSIPRRHRLHVNVSVILDRENKPTFARGSKMSF